MRKVLLIGVPGILLGFALYNVILKNAPDAGLEPSTESQAEAANTGSTNSAPVIQTGAVTSNDSGKVFSLHYGLKAEFDLFIFEQEKDNPDALIAAFLQTVINRNLTPGSQDYLVELFSRYVQYKMQLETLDRESGTQDIRAIANRLEARNDLRHSLFSRDEYHYLFSKDAQYDDAALARLQIASDASLSDEEKRRLIEDQLASLPADQQASFAPSLEVNRIEVLAKTYANPETRYQAIAAEFGHDVAQRMHESAQAQDDWKSRVKAFQLWQEEMQALNLTQAELQEKIAARRNQDFTENEQRRLRVFLENPALLDGE